MLSSIGLYRQFSLICIMSLSVVPIAFAQGTQVPQAQQRAGSSSNTAQTLQNSKDRSHITTAENTEEAWSMLTMADDDSKYPDIRIQSLPALGTLGNDIRAEKLIAKAMTNPDIDVRTAACRAAGLTDNRNLGNHWIKVKDSNQIHQRYVTPYGNVIGEYYLPPKPTYPGKYSDRPYVAQCFDGKPEYFAEEIQAKNFIEHCKNTPD